ncbi:MAG: LysM peptidoglycan-binding domain-containing protein [Kiritimatiellia bacterium]|nr:LysM peptidoglycan-binding domain-containing protein [Kiritimatiellia bacterium]
MKQNKYIKLFFRLSGGCVLTACLLTGCATYDDSRSATQEREDYLLFREDLNRCKSRLETMEIEQQRILNEIQQLRSQGQDENTKARLDEFERRIVAMDAARASDRQAIIDQISANVAKMMSASSPKTTPKTAASSGRGYEHIVKAGETLSTIAAAYKVKLSAIMEANDLKNPDALRKGQKLFIPQ